ncbi:hypothetical protein [Pseudomonas sp. S1(2024)]|uniref:hypothetical protein n=1 Tax=Pseudomonas sp. S1(2024) TaxID=3390191 RepID=UPI003978AAAD
MDTLFVDRYSKCVQGVEQIIIRHCPVCIAQGYHSVLFQFALFDTCPWHGHKLISCASCTRAISQKQGMRFTLHEGYYEASLKCGHFYFNSKATTRFDFKTDQQVQAYLEKAFLCAEWLERCTHSSTPFAHVLGQLTHDKHLDERLIKIMYPCYCWALSIGLACPWPSVLDALSYPCADFSIMHLGAANRGNTQGVDLKIVLKSIRRHLFKKFVRPHKKCYSLLSSFTQKDLHCLDATWACSAASAFIAWERSISYLDGGDWADAPNKVSTGWAAAPEQVHQVASLWLLHFYTIWGGIERNCQGCKCNHDRFSVELASSVPPLRLGEDSVVIYNSQDKCTDVLLALHCSEAWLRTAASVRCATRRQYSDMVNHRSRETVQFWAYVVRPEVWMRYWVGNQPRTGAWRRPVSAG